MPKVEPATVNLRDYLFTGTAGLVAAAGQFVVVTCLVYFLLVSGDTFRRTLLRVSGDTLTKKKITLQILDEIDLQIQRYLLVQLFTSAMLGAICWAIFLWIGLQDALLWGVVGGILHLIPYVGPFAFVVVISIIAFVQFDTIQPVFVLLGSVITMIGIIGMLLVPWLTGKVGRIKAVTVFLSLLVWGWLWGIWGLLLGVPIVMAINAICERVEDLQPISLFLGYGPDDEAQAAKDVAATDHLARCVGENLRNHLAQLARQIADRAAAPSQQRSRPCMREHAPCGGLIRSGAARREPGDDSGQHVARPRHGETRVRAVVHPWPRRWRRDAGQRALESDDGAARVSADRRRGNRVGFDRFPRGAHELRHFTCVRGEDRRHREACSPSRMTAVALRSTRRRRSRRWHACLRRYVAAARA